MTRLLFLLFLFSNYALSESRALTLPEKLRHHTLEFSKAPHALPLKKRLALVIELNSNGPSPLNPALIAAICTDTLDRGRVPSFWDKTFLAEFEAGADATAPERRAVKMALKQLTDSHLVLAIQLQLNRETQRYGMSAQLAAHQFQNRKGDPLEFQSVTLWSSQLSAGDSIERADLEPRLAQWLRRELKNLSGRYPKLNFAPAFDSNAPVYAEVPPIKPQEDGPTLKLFDYQLGLSLGTPAIANLHAGIWGSRRFPFAFQVSGMFWGRETRAVQGELLWLHDTDGALQQGFGAAIIGFNEHVTERVEITGGPVQNETIDRLRPHFGPVYVVTWKNFRAELGVSFRLGSGQDSAVRPLFQFGYTPNL